MCAQDHIWPARNCNLVDRALRFQGGERVGPDRAHDRDLRPTLRYQLLALVVVSGELGNAIGVVHRIDHDVRVHWQNGSRTVVDLGWPVDRIARFSQSLAGHGQEPGSREFFICIRARLAGKSFCTPGAPLKQIRPRSFLVPPRQVFVTFALSGRGGRI
jgi:hypothetical protein